MIDVLMISHNEVINLPYSLKAVQGWTRNIFVIDSGSTDGSQELARSHGAQVAEHPWEGYARQRNWGLNNLPFESDWVLIIDADEIITPQLRTRLEDIASQRADQVEENGFFINRLTFFMDQAIRHCGYFPNWNMRFFKRGSGHYEDREVHEHIIIQSPVGYIRQAMHHHDRRGLEHYVAKHNRYSTLEARALYRELQTGPAPVRATNLPTDIRRRRWLKRNVMPYLPLTGFWRFLYMYVLRLGVVDGVVGFRFAVFISQYDSMVALKLRELFQRMAAADHQVLKDLPPGLAKPEGSEDVLSPASPPIPLEADQEVGVTQTQPEPSAWSFWEKVARAVWMVMGKPLFRCSFHNWYGFRARILRIFGARIGTGVAIRPSVNIEIPWMLEIDDDASIGDHAVIYSLGKVTIGKRAIISQYSYLCGGTHDYTDHRFRLIRSPVSIGEDVWVGADVFVGPGVHIGSLAVVGARSSVYKNLEAGRVYVGNPAKPIKRRVLR